MNRIDCTEVKGYFIGVDSDGCVFDSLEIKQKRCFGPQFIKYFKLEMIAEQAREVWEFVNIYSRTRGVNRFKALIRTIDLLKERFDSSNYTLDIPELSAVRNWVESAGPLCNETLELEFKKSGNEEFAHVLAWSREIDRTVIQQANRISVFPMALECLRRMSECSDITVISQTPEEVIRREWNSKSLIKYVRSISGQEAGTKTEQLTKVIGSYDVGKCLMIGDAWVDYSAARDAGILFYPIIPGKEIHSWRQLYDEAFERFLSGTYAGNYAENLIYEFGEVLPEKPFRLAHTTAFHVS